MNLPLSLSYILKVLAEGKSQLQHSALRRFYWQWTLVTLVSFLASLLFVEIGERTELGAIEGTMGGATVGLTQALVLSQCFSHAWLWMVANLVGWGLMSGSGLGAIGWVAPGSKLLIFRCLGGAIWGALGGLWLGIWQWLVLRQRTTAGRRWIGMMAACWSLGLSVGWTLGGWLRSTTHLFLGEILGLAVTWAIVGSMTGLGAIRLKGKKLG